MAGSPFHSKGSHSQRGKWYGDEKLIEEIVRHLDKEDSVKETDEVIGKG